MDVWVEFKNASRPQAADFFRDFFVSKEDADARRLQEEAARAANDPDRIELDGRRRRTDSQGTSSDEEYDIDRHVIAEPMSSQASHATARRRTQSLQTDGRRNSWVPSVSRLGSWFGAPPSTSADDDDSHPPTPIRIDGGHLGSSGDLGSFNAAKLEAQLRELENRPRPTMCTLTPPASPQRRPPDLPHPQPARSESPPPAIETKEEDLPPSDVRNLWAPTTLPLVELDRLAEIFAAQLPEYEFSVADLQGCASCWSFHARSY